MPSISAITPSTFDAGRSVTLTGSGFGASQGSVLIGGVAQNVNTWSDTSITFTTVRGSQSLGACRVDVVGSGGTSYTPTVIVTNQTELNTELAKSAAALEGAVIGVQYNATPYVITRGGTPNLLNKNFGAGGLVITRYGETAPVFLEISIDDSQNITLHNLLIYNIDGVNNAGLLSLYDSVWGLTIDSCVFRGKYYNPNGDYSVASSYLNRRAISVSAGSGKYLKNITIRNNEMYDVRRGFALTVSGTFTVEGNIIHDTYEDPMAFGYGDDDGGIPTVSITWNTMYHPIGKASDADNPHFDFIQFLDPGLAVTWSVQVIGNIGFIGSARGDFQGIFCNFSTTGAYIGGSIKGNLILNNSSHGITIDRASNLSVIGNTCVSGDVDGGGLNTAISIGSDGTTGTHVVKNNVTHAISAAGSPTITNNHTTTRSTSAYSAIFNGIAFDKTTLNARSAVLSGLAMKASGALDQAVNIGAVGSGYADYDARTINGALE